MPAVLFWEQNWDIDCGQKWPVIDAVSQANGFNSAKNLPVYPDKTCSRYALIVTSHKVIEPSALSDLEMRDFYRFFNLI